MAAGWTAMRFGWASYIVPFLFVYSPALIMRGSAVEIGLVMILSIAGNWFVCAAFTEAFLNAELNAILVGSPEKERAGLVRAQTASHLFRFRSAARTRLQALAA